MEYTITADKVRKDDWIIIDGTHHRQSPSQPSLATARSRPTRASTCSGRGVSFLVNGVYLDTTWFANIGPAIRAYADDYGMDW